MERTTRKECLCVRIEIERMGLGLALGRAGLLERDPDGRG